MAFTVIPERTSPAYEREQTFVYHLMAGDWDEAAWWQPILCGEGISLPHREVVPTLDEVCPACRAASVERQKMGIRRGLTQ